jgi:hypothetical protein
VEKMKKLIYITFSVVLVFASGCADYLEEDNKGGINNASFYSTETGFNTLVTASYASLRTIYGNQQPSFDLSGTDIYQEGKNNLGDLTRYQTLNAANSDLKRFYVDTYKAIQNTNTALSYIDLPPLTSAKKQQLSGEMRFLRAFYHFILIEQFGGICIDNEYTASPRTSIPRSSLAESYSFVISEMEQALGDLPVSSDVGRVIKSTANHYLAKVYLTRAWDLGADADFTKAIQYADAVIASKGAITLTNKDVWDPNKQNNAEGIFTVQYSLTGVANTLTGGNNQSSLYSVLSGSTINGLKKSTDYVIPAQYIHASFQDNDSRYAFNFMLVTRDTYFNFYPGFVGSGPIVNYYPVIKDPLKTTITAADIAAWDAFVNANGGKATGYLAFPVWAGASAAHKTLYNTNGWATTDKRVPPFKKFDSPQNVTGSTQGNNGSVTNIVLARLAETYFLKAEALIGLNQFTQARDVVQLVLNRPGNKISAAGPDLTNALTGVATKTAALEAYMLETGKEMLGEYNGRWPLLRRTKMLKFMVEKYNSDFARNGITWKDHWVLRPIPQDAIQLNDALEFDKDQNPGW